MMRKNIFILWALAIVSQTSCTKNALDQKPNATLAVPSTISDYQALLDGIEGGAINNAPGLYSYRSLGDYLADEVTVSDNNYTTFFAGSPFITGVLEWNQHMFSSLTQLLEWDKQYQVVLNANIAIEGVNAIARTSSNQVAWNNVMGMGLFLRGQMFYNLAQFWARPYNAATASSDVGIVLRLSSDPNPASVRSNVQQTYTQILSDLKAAVPLLPNTSAQNTQVSKVRPSKAAAYAMLARVYLAMGDSIHVGLYADSALQLYSTLMDYNNVPYFSNFNAETIYTSMDQSGTIGNTYGPWAVDSTLVNLYDNNDLRKTLFFTNNAYVGGYAFIGDYSGYYSFTGIAVDELYLLRAESYARQGNVNAAMADLNTLLLKRYTTGTFTPRTAAGASDALAQVLTERRKELVMRGERWTDLRRLNARFPTTLTRTLLGVTYTLPPNDDRYTLAVPDYIIAASNGSITQTP
ncbi:RagB/SusD family nutrient uptake outer membrane protein [Dinghuibacter silviterrae]|uniref:RagB/SusD domain-containing protein n=1 Tax=Dinghuibacter silviterrae TaxID=1539049 RepID=A0A4R8DIA9_9BACT|nr:RagB/SusD family nutrient uptake outer membrane protein [Dinghuibacter silviterrae]TDW97469.1 RagB/SusD domain-containing protein [Dinghuibacter silviterrae]